MSDNGKWGYASYDVDKYDDYSDSNLGYTRYSGDKVDKYHDNGDGGHSHESWNSSSDYNSGNDADYSRSESNSSGNPSVENVQGSDGSGCYLTSACMKHMKENFDDNCYELTLLRWFRDSFVSKYDINHYYEVAPSIVAKIDSLENNNKIYDWIYENIVSSCVKAINNDDYEFAYNIYKNSVLALEEQFIDNSLKIQNGVNKPKVRTI